MSQASVAPPKPPSSIPNCYSGASLHPPPNSAKHGIALEPAVSEYGSGDGDDGVHEASVHYLPRPPSPY
ncbi:hypothetical protein A2U01_0018966 [Trifolium medium]|uniref:Uncharacterized protein n=1 Tax=Trifolium medium TaxID=97028 RepID=A0A392NFV7_9FABA|nr:hypothetical protein [Trifolium medium]